ncbi:phosphatase PAP2 family protein [Sphingomonas koreensis]|nr:phosphatase PAP2 family protein [Sphingomonas koreensis]
MRMRPAYRLAVLALGVALIAQPAMARNTRAWNDAGGIVRDGLVLAALGIPAAKGDWAGDLQAAGSMGMAELAAVGLKESFPERRPDGSDRRSCPSGHAALSFAAAATLQNRYGWAIGVPAQVAASFVGLSRIEARKHHWYDVMVGAGIGETSGFLITSKRYPGVAVLPWGDTHGGGATIAARF